MKTKVFTVHDAKAEAYLRPFFMQTTGQAIRSFTDVVNDESTEFNKHSEDYTLFEIGEYNEMRGLLIPHDILIPLGKAIEFKINQKKMDIVQNKE